MSPQSASFELPPVVESETSNSLRVRSNYGVEFTIEEPILGRDYLAGYLNNRTYFQLIRKSSIEILLDIPKSFLELGFSRLSAGEMLARQQLPTMASVRLLTGNLLKLWLQEIDRGFLIAKSEMHFAIPVAGISEILLPAGSLNQPGGRVD